MLHRQAEIMSGQDLGMVALIGRNLGVPVVDDLAAVIDGCDVIIDFSTRENALKVLDLAVKHGKALVCGTTGFSEEEFARFKEAAKDNPDALCSEHFQACEYYE